MSLSNVAYITTTFAFLPILVAVVVFLWRFKLINNDEKWIGWLSLVALVAQLVSSALWHAQQNNLWVSHVYTPIELALLLFWYRGAFEAKVSNAVMLVLNLAIVLLAVLNGLLWESILEINSLPRSVESVVLITLSLLLWAKVMRELKTERLVDKPAFWFNAAIILYFSGNALLFWFSTYLFTISNQTKVLLWVMHSCFMLVYYVLFSIGLWKAQKT